MYDTSLLVFQSEIPDQVYKEPEYGLNLYPLAEALVYATPRYFQVEKIAARTCGHDTGRCRYIKCTDEKRGFASCRKNSRGVPEHREQRNRRQHRFHDAGGSGMT